MFVKALVVVVYFVTKVPPTGGARAKCADKGLEEKQVIPGISMLIGDD